MEWITPVTDRTQEDIERKTKKAYLNVTDLNRIENNTKYLANILLNYGYQTNYEPYKRRVYLPSKGYQDITEWNEYSLLYKADLERISRNVQKLRDNYIKVTGDISIKEKLHYTTVNNLEKILKETNEYLEEMIAAFKKCGAFQCGQKIFLPLKRK